MKQNIEKLEIIPVIPTIFPREEKCKVCQKNLVEEISSEIISYIKYNTRDKCPDGSDIYCPSCKIIYKHSHSFGAILKKYCNEMKATHGISMLRLKEDFVVSQFENDESHVADIPKDTIWYCPVTPNSSRELFEKYLTKIRKLKPGLTKEKDGYYAAFLSDPPYHCEKNWDTICALYVTQTEDVARKYAIRPPRDMKRFIRIPISMLDFPDEFYSDYPEGNLIPRLEV